MKNLFNVEGKFMDYGTKVANLIILNFLTILFSVPIDRNALYGFSNLPR